MTIDEKRDIWLTTVIIALIILVMALIEAFVLTIDRAEARDLGQWGDSEVAQWFKSLNRPDMPPGYPCCGEADAYWCDEVHVSSGKTSCAITDDRDDGPLRRPHIPIGTVVQIPDSKLKWDKGNPTGHAILFYVKGSETVMCFVQGSGI